MDDNFRRRFWQKVRKTPTCWIWTGAILRARGGYGAFDIRGNGENKAHRASWVIAFGPIPNGLFVLHRCDTPSCVNPAHLFLGTNADNMRDMAQKGRHFSKTKPHRLARGDRNGARARPERLARGERAGAAKLSADDVMAIRGRHAAGETLASLGRGYGVSYQNIGDIVNRQTWKHI